jgi:hypothetical protein
MDIYRVEKVDNLKSLKKWKVAPKCERRFSLVEKVRGKDSVVFDAFAPEEMADCIAEKVTERPVFSTIKAREMYENALAECQKIREVI